MMTTNQCPAATRTGSAFVRATGVIGALTLLAGCGAQPAPSDEATDASHQEARLGAVPGFGMTSSESQRDDILAYWEAYQRDLAVSECMAESGFTWHPEALFPEPAIRTIADALGVQAEPTNTPPARVANQEAVATFEPDELNEYYQALYGLDAATVQQIMRDQGSDGDIDLGSVGCSARGAITDDSVWSLRDRIEPDVSAARLAFRETAEFEALQEQARECAGQFGIPEVIDDASADRAMDEGLSPDTVTSMTQACAAIWEGRSAAEQEYISRAVWEAHEAELLAQQEHYDQVLEQVRTDETFRSYLAVEAGA